MWWILFAYLYSSFDLQTYLLQVNNICPANNVSRSWFLEYFAQTLVPVRVHPLCTLPFSAPVLCLCVLLRFWVDHRRRLYASKMICRHKYAFFAVCNVLSNVGRVAVERYHGDCDALVRWMILLCAEVLSVLACALFKSLNETRKRIVWSFSISIASQLTNKSRRKTVIF